MWLQPPFTCGYSLRLHVVTASITYGYRPAGGVDPEPTADDPHPKLRRLREEFSHTAGDADGNVWDPFALELIDAATEDIIKRHGPCVESPSWDLPPLMGYTSPPWSACDWRSTQP